MQYGPSARLHCLSSDPSLLKSKIRCSYLPQMGYHWSCGGCRAFGKLYAELGEVYTSMSDKAK